MSYSQFSRKVRLPLGFLLAIVYLVFARPEPVPLAVGVCIALAGLAVRAWAAGHISKNTRLSVSGPYAHVRNPLYLGSFLVALGFAVAWRWWFVLLVIAFFVLIYAPTMHQEKLNIGARFPGEFPEYERNVPAFVPRLTRWRPSWQAAAVEQRFSPDLYMRHAEWKAALGFAAGTGWLLLRLGLGL